MPQRAAASFWVMPAAHTADTTRTQFIRFRIFEVYTNSDLMRKHFCYKQRMSARNVLLRNLLHHMERRGVTNMTELAHISGVSQSVLSRFQSGRHHSLSFPNIDKIARALHIDVAQLFFSSTDFLPAHQSEAFAGVMEELIPPNREVVLATGRALVESQRKGS